MNRRDAFRGIVAGASVGLSGAAAEASFQPTVPFGPRLVRPNRGARLEAWLAESDRRSADVAIDWERGLLRVTLYEDARHESLNDGWDRWVHGSPEIAKSASIPEDAPGSFTPEDAGILALIATMDEAVADARAKHITRLARINAVGKANALTMRDFMRAMEEIKPLKFPAVLK